MNETKMRKEEVHTRQDENKNTRRNKCLESRERGKVLGLGKSLEIGQDFG